MAILARSLIKALLLAGLFFLSIRYIYGALLFFPPWHELYSFVVSEFLGFHDIELFDAIFGLSAGLTLAIIEFMVLMKIWKHGMSKRRTTP